MRSQKELPDLWPSSFYYDNLHIPLPPRDGNLDSVSLPEKVQINRSVHYSKVSQADAWDTFWQ